MKGPCRFLGCMESPSARATKNDFCALTLRQLMQAWSETCLIQQGAWTSFSIAYISHLWVLSLWRLRWCCDMKGQRIGGGLCVHAERKVDAYIHGMLSMEEIQLQVLMLRFAGAHKGRESCSRSSGSGTKAEATAGGVDSAGTCNPKRGGQVKS
eukprot:1156199-Pelagomonas_calceolata.AAC.5